MSVETRQLSFQISGEFITRTARDWFFKEQKPYKVIEELLLSCMCGTDTPEGQLKLYAQDVLLGKAEFRGNTADGDFRYVILDEPADVNIFEEYCKLSQARKNDQTRINALVEKIEDVEDALAAYAAGYCRDALENLEDKRMQELLADVMKKNGDVLVTYQAGGGKRYVFIGEEDEEDLVIGAASTGSSILDSYLAQARIEDEFSDNYGWLEPNGTFHPVEWGEHQGWAYTYGEEKKWWGEDAEEDPFPWDAGDKLCERGWVLLHSPGMGVADVTIAPGMRLTKAQREFLFDYYDKRGQKSKARNYLEED